MSKIFKNILEQMGKSCFCVAKDGGEGFVDKTLCECFQNDESNCQANLDKNKFHSYFEEAIGCSRMELSYDEYMLKTIKVRKDVIKRADIELKDSQWYKDNVK